MNPSRNCFRLQNLRACTRGVPRHAAVYLSMVRLKKFGLGNIHFCYHSSNLVVNFPCSHSYFKSMPSRFLFRSMPTSAALDLVAKNLNLFFEVHITQQILKFLELFPCPCKYTLQMNSRSGFTSLSSPTDRYYIRQQLSDDSVSNTLLFISISVLGFWSFLLITGIICYLTELYF